MHRKIVPFLMPKGEYVAARDESNFTGTCKVQLLRSSSRWSSDVEREVICFLFLDNQKSVLIVFFLYSTLFTMPIWNV